MLKFEEAENRINQRKKIVPKISYEPEKSEKDVENLVCSMREKNNQYIRSTQHNSKTIQNQRQSSKTDAYHC
jgi:ABC-type Zn uptake system ZnuABC Zn-binding protein ZnuA